MNLRIPWPPAPKHTSTQAHTRLAGEALRCSAGRMQGDLLRRVVASTESKNLRCKSLQPAVKKIRSPLTPTGRCRSAR